MFFMKARDNFKQIEVSPEDPLPVDATVVATIGDWAIANAADPTNVEGDPAPGSVDLKGYSRTRGPASAETSAVYNGNTALTPKFAKIALSATGTVVAAVGGKKIRVLAYVLTASGSLNAKFQSHITPTDLTGLLYMAATIVVEAPFNPVGWFETVSGEALDLNLSAGNVGGHLVYVEV